MVYVAVYMLIS